MNALVSYDRRGPIAVVMVNNPPVNALAQGVRQGLKDGVAAGGADPEVKAIVVIGGGRTFPAGADITEFGKPLAEPGLGAVIDSMEMSDKPVIAAIHGTALGGGLEICLGCHFRVAAPTAQVGLPEVTLGILPGAGGTQRTPRLVGAQAALEMITSGQFVKAPKARDMGLIDEIVEGDLLDGAIAFAEKVVAEGRPVRRTRDLTVTADPALFEQFEKGIARKARGFLSPFKCIEAVRNATILPFDEGIRRERELFMELVTSDHSKGQRHIFFAERTAAKVADLPKDTPVRDVAAVGIVGAGTMGGGIAMNFVNVGIPVTLVEASQEALEKGLAVIARNYANTVSKGRLSQDAMDKRMSLITGTLDYADLAQADLVIEAVFEGMDLKKEVFGKLDATCKPGAILATNTSTLDVNEIAAATGRPGDVIGLHFFSPANVMRLLEIVRGAETSHEVIATSMKLARTIRKVGVLVGVCDGFVGNRILAAYLNQAFQMLEEGALPAQVDKVMYDFGLAMGPFAMGDLAGNDVGWRVRQERFPVASRDASYVGTIADRLCEAGRFGQKTAKGWYDYAPGSRTPVPSDEVEKVILAVSEEKGITRRQIDDEEILKRCLYAMVNEGAKILEEGIAQRSSDIDVVYVFGYGFPVYRGGPMFHADLQGLKNVYADVVAFHERLGDAWSPAMLLERLAGEGKSFSDL
ncbi:MAG: enoyl-CoA hydratase/isomerase family protein [Hyphomicrobiales bacterium]|nr:enoyl-CoA hydratase/isomerase family protein [Hyphomicrobiales bacterium]